MSNERPKVKVLLDVPEEIHNAIIDIVMARKKAGNRTASFRGEYIEILGKFVSNLNK